MGFHIFLVGYMISCVISTVSTGVTLASMVFIPLLLFSGYFSNKYVQLNEITNQVAIQRELQNDAKNNEMTERTRKFIALLQDKNAK